LTAFFEKSRRKPGALSADLAVERRRLTGAATRLAWPQPSASGRAHVKESGMAKERAKRKAKKPRDPPASGSAGRPGQPEMQAAAASHEAPPWLLPPRVSWRDDSHAKKARGPKRVQRRIERIAKWVWRSIPDREQRVISLAQHDIFLMSGPVAEGSPDRPLDEISKLACWKGTLGILLNVEGEASDPGAEDRFSYLIAHELAHAYLNSASWLISAGAGLLPGKAATLKSQIPALQAVAAAYGPMGERDSNGEEMMVTALAISWVFGDGYLACWLLDRQLKGLKGKDADPAEVLALITRYAR
jgi:hypothetical protein